jgi:hypothetical protein
MMLKKLNPIPFGDLINTDYECIVVSKNGTELFYEVGIIFGSFIDRQGIPYFKFSRIKRADISMIYSSNVFKCTPENKMELFLMGISQKEFKHSKCVN